MTPDSARREDEDPSLRPRKRARYTQIACNECKRRKLKCSGGTVCTRCARDEVSCVYASTRSAAAAQEMDIKDDQINARFRAVDLQLEALQHEMRTLSARLRELESAGPDNSSKKSVATTTAASASASNIASAGALHRILNPPSSPTFVGPTSAEFGLGQQGRSQLHERANDHLDNYRDDEHLSLSTAAPSTLGSEHGDDLATDDSLGGLSLNETLRLVQVYEDTVGIVYPCVDLASLRTYIIEHYQSRSANLNPRPNSDSVFDPDWFYARDMQVLRILIATALLVESHGRSERAARLADSVEDRFATRVKIAQVDMKETLILTLLSIFHSYRDDEVIAWRTIGMAVRGSMQLGLHCRETWQKTGGVFPGALESMWASRLFWCIYVLDRKWSFGTGLPFAIQDSDMDINLPEPGHSTPYLTCMISYARLSTKIWTLVVGWGNQSREATSERCAYLDTQVQEWVQSIPHELRFDPSWRSPAGAEHTDRTMMLQVLLALQANQLRTLVYRQHLLSTERIQEDMTGATTAVETAKSTIHMLSYYSRISDVYSQRPEPFNYFLISALAALFLSVLHAPGRFSHTCRPEFYTAIDMVRRSATRARTSRRLQKIIRSLKLIKLNVKWQSRDKEPIPAQRHQSSNSILESRLALESRADSFRSTLDSRGLWGVTPVSSHASSPTLYNEASLYQPSGNHTPQTSSTNLWPQSAGTAAENESNVCEDLSSFFEIAGGLYFKPTAGADLTTNTGLGLHSSNDGTVPNAFATSPMEDEALTRVMAGLL